MAATHHYVPQFYLKYFAKDKGGSSVWAYERDKPIITTNVRNVAGEKDFYTFTDKRTGKKSDELERVYSELEAKAKIIIDGLNKPGKIDLKKEDKGDLAYFIISLHMRGLSERQSSANAYGGMQKLLTQLQAQHKESFKEVAKKSGKKFSEEELEEARQFALSGEYEVKFNPRDEYFLKQAMRMEAEIYPYIYVKDMYLATTATSRLLVTSDNPVSILMPEDADPFRGVGVMNGIIAVPLSPTKCLVMVNPNARSPVLTLNRQQTDTINGHTMFFAHKFVFSNIKSKDFQLAYDKTKVGGGERYIMSSPFDRATKRKRT